jgi:hypothetical protein
MIDPFPEIPELEAEENPPPLAPPTPPSPVLIDHERENARREVERLRKAAENAEIEERRKRYAGKPMGSEHAQAETILKAKGIG